MSLYSNDDEMFFVIKMYIYIYIYIYINLWTKYKTTHKNEEKDIDYNFRIMKTRFMKDKA